MTIDRAVIERVCSSWGVSRLRVFGSVARGDAASGSDLDLLVEFSRQVSLLDLVGLEQDLEDALGIEVDVVTPASLSSFIRDEVLREAKVIYEQPAA